MSKLTHLIYLTIIAFLGAAVIWLVGDAPVDADQKTEAQFGVSSIAVLPFIANGLEGSATQIAESVSSKIIRALSSNPRLRVVSEDKTRVFADSISSLTEIGNELSVSTILEGSVHTAQEDVRVTVQLIDVRTDEHVWSETYNGNIGNLDNVVADIERTILALAHN